MLADKGYESKHIRKLLKLKRYTIYIPKKRGSRSNYAFDRRMYKLRVKIEHFFARLKLFRRVMVRYDSLLETYSGFVHLALVYIIFERFHNFVQVECFFLEYQILAGRLEKILFSAFDLAYKNILIYDYKYQEKYLRVNGKGQIESNKV